MCGIAGIIRVHPPQSEPPPPPLVGIPDEWLEVLDAAIAHRGPDGSGCFRDRARRSDGSIVDVALVHRRLAIIDPRDGTQPMISAASQDPTDLLATVFNGCIYNHAQLRRELEALGHRFATHHSDTEVLLHGQRAWGGEVLAQRLDGMFAFATWDRRSATLTLARDRAGEKPLYHTHLGEHMYAFASTAVALVKLRHAIKQPHARRPGLIAPDAPSPSGVAAWLRFGGSLITPYEQIDEFDVGVVATYALQDWGDGVAHNAAACDWFEDPNASRTGPALTVDALGTLLDDAVRSRLESDVPLACFLSGGVDSSIVASLAQKHLGLLRTFTVQMPDPALDESAKAAEVARLLGTRHETLPCESSPAQDLVHLIHQLGLPFADSSLLPTYWLSRAVRQHATVALSGDGGDELFAGYERHQAARWLASYRAPLSLIPTWLARGASARSRRAKLARLGDAARSGYDDLLAIFPRRELSLLIEDAPRHLPPAYPHIPTTDAPHHDFRWYLPGDLMRKSDTASMSVALEVRSPLLATAVVRAALATPLDALTPGGQRKGLLRAAAARLLPRHIVDQPKSGFAIPLANWLRSDFGGLRTLMLDHIGPAATDPFPEPLLGLRIRRSRVETLIAEHDAGVRDHAQRLYALTVLAIWCRWRARMGAGSA
jgi:asparagine synthase (glutamine-hydrolysing)